MRAEFVLDYDVIAVAREHNLYVMARIQADAPPEIGDRRPLNLSVVLDRSGSMGGDKLAYVKQAAGFLVQRLGGSDRLSVVSYDHRVTVDVQPEAVIHKDRITQAIDQLTAGGTTNLSGGWLQGCQLVAGNVADGQINRVLLLTDGLANQGVTDPVRLETMARQKRAEGITTTTMGVGMDFNEDLLTRMASEGGGAFYFIDNPDQAPHIFAEELKDLLSVVGQNLVITLIPSRDVRMVRQLNAYPTEDVPGGTAFRLGDLFAEEVKSVVLELSIPALEDLGEVEVARLKFEYDELGEDSVTHRELELPVMVNTVPEDEFAEQEPDAEVVKTALLLEAARAREQAIDHADQGAFDEASQVLTDTASLIRDSGINDPDLEQQHDMLREEAVDMEFGADRYDAYARKSTRTKSFYTERPTMSEHTTMLHTRLKQSRDARERDGDTPDLITWGQDALRIPDDLRIGRADDNDIVVRESEVSAYHCRITRADDALFLEDLDSTNGTFANGGQVTGRFRLSVGDVITVGTRLFTLEGAS
jgi:Ca-activated chloride channel homolog